MESSGTGSGPWTRGKKKIAAEEETREEEKKQMKKRKEKMFGPRLIPSATSNLQGTSGKSILIGTNDIVVNPNIQKIQLPENFEVKPEIKEEEMEVEHSTIVVLQDNYYQNPVPVTNEIDLEDDVGGTEAVGVEESEEIIEKLKEKDLRIQELELELESEKQSNQQLSMELAKAKGAKTSNENDGMNATNEDNLYSMIREILNGNSREKLEPLVKNVNEDTSNLMTRAIQIRKSRENVETLVKMVEDWKVERHELNSSLHIAARAGNLELLKYEILLGRGVNSRNVHGSTPLMEAARGNQNFLEVADLLIRSGADLRATNNSGENALFIAVETCKPLEEIRKLCFEDCLKVKCSRRGDTVLHRAAMSGNLEALEHFMSLKPDVNVKNDIDGSTPLMSAAYFANQNFSMIMDLLLRNGADASSVDNDGFGVLGYAIPSRKYRIPVSDLKKLIDAGAEWDKNSILHLCITMGHTEALKYFAANGANLDDDRPPFPVTRPKPFPPLSRVAHLGNIEAMVSLLDNGATNFNGYIDLENDRFFSRATMEVLDKLSKVRDIWDDSMLHGFARNGNLEGVRWCVLKKKADVNMKDPEGITLIYLAATAEEPNLELLDFLIEFGADVNTVNWQGFNALHGATERGRSLEALETLITRYGAIWSNGVVGRWYRRESILHAAIIGGLPEVVEYFISRGVEVNCRDFKGDTPLIHSVKWAEKNLPHIWRALVKGGADPNTKDSNGNSALLLGVDEGEHGNALLSLDQLNVLVDLGCDWRVPNTEGVTVLSKLEGDGNAEVLEYFRSLR